MLSQLPSPAIQWDKGWRDEFSILGGEHCEGAWYRPGEATPGGFKRPALATGLPCLQGEFTLAMRRHEKGSNLRKAPAMWRRN